MLLGLIFPGLLCTPGRLGDCCLSDCYCCCDSYCLSHFDSCR